jgi:glutathione S-transferase
MTPSHPTRLITIPFSHFCEKARWALDRAAVPYEEDAHAPLFHARVTMKATQGKSRTTPILIDGARTITDSTEILQHLADHHGATWLYPSPDVLAFEESLDKHFGPAVRCLGYYHMLPLRGPTMQMFRSHTPRWESAALGVIFPVARALMRKGLRINDKGAEWSRRAIAQTTEQVNAMLADGRPYLFGDHFSAADLTFAALASPMIQPPEHPRFPSANDAPATLRADSAAFLSSPAAAFARRMYTDERRSA